MRKAPVVPGLLPPAERVVDWQPGEREELRQWLPCRSRLTGELQEIVRLEGWEGVVREFVNGRITREAAQFSLFEHGPEELLRPLLANWRLELTRSSDFSILRTVTVRFEADALDVVFPNAKAHRSGWALMPFRDVEVARLMATWLGRSSTRRHAREWFARHGAAAVPFLVPDALGARRPRRDKAVAALLHIAARCGEADVVAAARPYGDQAADAVARILDGGAPTSKPRDVPWLDVDALPEVLLRDGRALPGDAVKNLVGALTLSPGVQWNAPAESYPGLQDALDLCDRASLAAFGWAVYERWEAAGAPSGNRWVVDQLIWLADDEVTGRLGTLALNGPASIPEDVTGVLADIGTDTALAQLEFVARRAGPGLRGTAKERIAWTTRRRHAGPVLAWR
ncbi:hypothetical protein [Nonomuraea sp. SBT364]|uniref:hypothetical protein n=1 Tax=Nonomuraea sp. SBT364 TaxID=1580530 RepID=UPI0012E16FC0|nr:hypothetical protein [Nonomuraea sp. SBT364]